MWTASITEGKPGKLQWIPMDAEDHRLSERPCFQSFANPAKTIGFMRQQLFQPVVPRICSFWPTAKCRGNFDDGNSSGNPQHTGTKHPCTGSWPSSSVGSRCQTSFHPAWVFGKSLIFIQLFSFFVGGWRYNWTIGTRKIEKWMVIKQMRNYMLIFFNMNIDTRIISSISIKIIQLNVEKRRLDQPNLGVRTFKDTQRWP